MISSFSQPTDKTAFEAEWLGGVANATVFNVDVASLDNSDDELILLDATGQVMWQRAYGG